MRDCPKVLLTISADCRKPSVAGVFSQPQRQRSVSPCRQVSSRHLRRVPSKVRVDDPAVRQVKTGRLMKSLTHGRVMGTYGQKLARTDDSVSITATTRQHQSGRSAFENSGNHRLSSCLNWNRNLPTRHREYDRRGRLSVPFAATAMISWMTCPPNRPAHQR